MTWHLHSVCMGSCLLLYTLHTVRSDSLSFIFFFDGVTGLDLICDFARRGSVMSTSSVSRGTGFRLISSLAFWEAWLLSHFVNRLWLCSKRLSFCFFNLLLLLFLILSSTAGVAMMFGSMKLLQIRYYKYVCHKSYLLRAQPSWNPRLTHPLDWMEHHYYREACDCAPRLCSLG
jgi:hypothetical protein